MISLYTGTPGSGKSFHAAKDIVTRLKRGGTLIANFPINLDSIKKVKGNFIYKDNLEMTVEFLVEYAKDNHVIGKEGQALVVIDEAQVIFNCREYGNKDRFGWVKFFSQHRKLGYNIILIAQNDKMIDKQIRALVEYEVKHRKINNYGFAGLLFSLTFQTYFVAIDYWYGMKGKDARLSSTFFRYQKKYANIYNSYELFDVLEKKETKLKGLSVVEGGNRLKPEGLPATNDNLIKAE